MATSLEPMSAAHDMWDAYQKSFGEGLERHEREQRRVRLERELMAVLDAHGGTLGAEALRAELSIPYLLFAELLRGLAEQDRVRLDESDEPCVARI